MSEFEKGETVFVEAKVIQTLYVGPFATPFVELEVNGFRFTVPEEDIEKEEENE